VEPISLTPECYAVSSPDVHVEHSPGAECAITDVLSGKVCNIVMHPSPCYNAFSASTLLVGRQELHPACKNSVVGCWHGYLSGV